MDEQNQRGLRASVLTSFDAATTLQPCLFQDLRLKDDETSGSDDDSDYYYDHGSDSESRTEFSFDSAAESVTWVSSLRLKNANSPRICMRNKEARIRPPVRSSRVLPPGQASASDFRRDLRRSGCQQQHSACLDASEKLSILTLEDDDMSIAVKRASTEGEANSLPKRCNDTAPDATANSEALQDSAHRDHEPRTGEDCDICQLFRMVHVHSSQATYTNLSTVRHSALAGQQCCSLVVDAVKTWLRHTYPKIYHAVQSGSGAIFDTMEVRICRSFRMKEAYTNDRLNLRPQIELRWTEYDDINDESQDESGPFTLLIFAPHGMKINKTILEFCSSDSQHVDTQPSSEDYPFINEFVRQYLPSGDTASRKAFDCLKTWINSCVGSHSNCASSSSQYVPKRVLELRIGKIILRERPSSCTRYACLSHCWGPDGLTFKLTRATLESLKSGIKPSDLPRTFQDATQICSRLQISYLWIDALCIVQDDHEDWDEAVRTMADIYENAFLTIAATASSNSNGGCYSDPHGRFKARKLDTSCLHVAEKHHWDDSLGYQWIRNLDEWPLMSRAWVFQERSLSSRFVHFTDTQLLWECHSMMKSESGDIDLDWTCNDFAFARSLETPFKYSHRNDVGWWHDTVYDYTKLDLSFSKDRLPALAAIAQRTFKRRRTDTYIAGCWESSLLRDLMWELNAGVASRIPLPLPTWSWASMTGSVWYRDEKNLKQARSIDIHYTSNESPETGYISDAAILLKCHSCCGYIDGLEERSGTCVFRSREEDLSIPLPVIWDAERQVQLDCDFSTSGQSVNWSDELVIAIIELGSWNSAWGGLVLRQVSTNDYERMGYFRIWNHYRKARVTREAKLRDNFGWRWRRQFFSSLPVRSFRII